MTLVAADGADAYEVRCAPNVNGTLGPWTTQLVTKTRQGTTFNGHAPRATSEVSGYHSYRNATIGSTFMARRAGNQADAAATRASRAGTTRNVEGLPGETPNSRPCRYRASMA